MAQQQQEFNDAYQAAIAEIPNQWNVPFVDGINGNDPVIRQTLANHMEDNLNAYNLRDYPVEIRDAIINQIRQQGIPELENAIQQIEPEAEQQLPFDRPEFPDALAQNMRDYFEGNAHNVPENMIEPYATETRILMGNQRPAARLDPNVHQELIRILLNQDRHTQDIRDLMNRLQRGNNLNILTQPQAENMLNMLIDWTERYPLNE
jgi:hypothetical protein